MDFDIDNREATISPEGNETGDDRPDSEPAHLPHLCDVNEPRKCVLSRYGFPSDSDGVEGGAGGGEKTQLI